MFIALAKEFFIKNTDQRMFDLLYSIWDAELVSRENHRLQMAIGLEAMASLVNKINKNQPKSQIEQEISEDDDKFYKTRDDAVKLLDSLKGEPGHITRLKNVVKRTAANDSGPKIEGAGASLGLTFAKKETQLWREMRHSAAHGESKDFDGKEKDFFASQSAKLVSSCTLKALNMTRAKLAVACIAILISTSGTLPIDAQGLKGAQMPEKILGRLPYVTGTNDQQRWKTFLDAQPKLVGMSFDAVCKRFGAGPITAPDRSYIEYGLTDEPVKSGTKGNTWLHLKIFFRNGIAHKYAVEAVP